MAITLDSGKCFSIEKNEHIHIIDNPKLQKTSEVVKKSEADIPDVTLNEFIHNAKKLMGLNLYHTIQNITTVKT